MEGAEEIVNKLIQFIYNLDELILLKKNAVDCGSCLTRK